jgi:hypothetical protein
LDFVEAFGRRIFTESRGVKHGLSKNIFSCEEFMTKRKALQKPLLTVTLY